MTTSRATLRAFGERDMYTAFHLPPPPFPPHGDACVCVAVTNVLCPPRITRLTMLRWPSEQGWLSRLPHLAVVDECVVDERQQQHMQPLFDALPAGMRSLGLKLEYRAAPSEFALGDAAMPLPAYAHYVRPEYGPYYGSWDLIDTSLVHL